MRVLALDYGSARCGIAVSDPTGTLATPLEPIAPGSDILEPVTLEAEEPVEASSIGPFYTLEPCASDEIPAGYVPNCYWDASERGNGLGYDFIWWEGEVFYPEFGR